MLREKIHRLFWILLSFTPFLGGCGPLGDLGKGLGDLFKGVKLPAP
jgi:hypothetical protein